MKMNVMKWSSLFFMAVALTAMSSCSDNNDNGDTDTTDPVITYPTTGDYANIATSEGVLFNNETQIGNGDKEFCFTGKQTIKKGTYSLKGWVYVRPGAELTIEAGTIIKGDKATQAALIIEPGAKIYAEGTASSPIVFTSAQAAGSRRPGDWGGLIICGNGLNNNTGGQQIEGGPKTMHGGNIADDNSGVLRYIRVEFAGYPFQKDKEINGITFGSVGSGTTVDHLQVSYSNDDSYEWFGGSVNCKYLIAYKGWDDDFDTDNGFSGHVQFGLSVRDPRIADTSQSNGFESDNNANGDDITPYTKCVFSNMTFIGPMTQKNLTAGFVNDDTYITAGTMKPDNEAALGKFQASMHIRRNSKLNCYNSVTLGWPIGLIIDGEKGNCRAYATNGDIKLQNVFFAGMAVTGTDYNKKYEDELGTWALVGGVNTISYDSSQPSFSTTFFKSQSGCQWGLTEAQLNLSDPKSVGQNYCPASGSPLLNAASFSGLTSSFMNTNVTYVGAFSGASDTWMDGWTNFDPENTAY
ncbi:hypothetical protein [uncultured Bacteroides sp.]|uniref:hypothetical protein n=1 Tax=uncultured Bacteroides sp. TaxID=162156 RepID=UPI002AA7CC53|nr:hypothetical protein [uncultured Bacteroides sp.]